MVSLANEQTQNITATKSQEQTKHSYDH